MDATLVYILIAFLYLISPTGSGTLYSYFGAGTLLDTQVKYEKAVQDAIEAQRLAEEQAIIDAEIAYQKLHTYANYKRAELEGYSVLSIPATHFNPMAGITKGKTLKYSYLDDLSYINITYKTDLTEENKERAGVQICGFKEEPEHEKLACGDYEVIRLVDNSTSNDSGVDYKKVSWCLFKGNTVLVINGYIASDVDITAFYECIETFLGKSNIYYISKVVFDMPTTGYYDYTIKSDIHGNTESTNGSEETENNQSVDNSENEYTISDNWLDMKISLDNSIIYVPCTIEDLMNLGYMINKSEELGDMVPGDYNSTLVLYKENGTTIRATVKNPTGTKLKIEALTVETLTIKVSDFGHYSVNPEFSKDTLPELKFIADMSWDARADDIVALLESTGSVSKAEQANGTFKIHSMSGNKQITVVTDNYKDILEIILTDSGE